MLTHSWTEWYWSWLNNWRDTPEYRVDFRWSLSMVKSKIDRALTRVDVWLTIQPKLPGVCDSPLLTRIDIAPTAQQRLLIASGQMYVDMCWHLVHHPLEITGHACFALCWLELTLHWLLQQNTPEPTICLVLACVDFVSLSVQECTYKYNLCRLRKKPGANLKRPPCPPRNFAWQRPLFQSKVSLVAPLLPSKMPLSVLY